MRTRPITLLILVGLILTGDRHAPARIPPVDLPAIPTSWRVLTTEDGLPHNSVRAVRAFGDDLWVGTDNGLARYSGGSWSRWCSDNGAFPGHRVTAIDVDPQTRDVWLGTWDEGLFRFTAGRFDRFDQLNSGLAGNLVFAVKVVAGRVWAATNGGLSAYDPGTDSWGLYLQRTTDRASVAVTALAPTEHRLNLGTWGHGILALPQHTPGPADGLTVPTDGGIDRHSPPQNGGRDEAIVAIFPRAGKLLWVSQGGIYEGDPLAHWERLARPSPYHVATARRLSDSVPTSNSFNYVYCAAAETEGGVWIGTERGVGLLADAGGATWIGFSRDSGSAGGWAFAMQGGRTIDRRRLPMAPPEYRIRCLAVDDSTVWLGTPNGLAVGTDMRAWKELPSGDVRPTAKDGEDLDEVGVSPHVTSEPRLAGPERSRLDVALYGPRTRIIALPGQFGRAQRDGRRDAADLLAFHLAIEASNRNGGSRRQTPFGAITQQAGYSRYGWGLPEDDLAAYAQDDDVVGIVGHVAPGDFMANVTALRTEVPIVSTCRAAWDPGDAYIENPWVFRCWGGEPRRHRLLVDYLIDELGLTRLVAVDVSDQAERVPFTWWVDRVRGRKDAQFVVAVLRAEAGEFDTRLRALRESSPEAIMTWCGAPAAGRLLRRLRDLGMAQPFVGGPSLLEQSFLELAGPSPGTVIALCPGRTHDVASGAGSGGTGPRKPGDGPRTWARFADQYAERNLVGAVHVPPDENAYRTFAATDHLLTAIQVAGADREALRGALQGMASSETGEKHYEELGPGAEVSIARLVHGKWVRQTLDGS